MTFHLEREVFQSLLIEMDYKQITNRSQTEYKQATKQTTQRTTNVSSSSSSLRSIEELLTTSDPTSSELDSAWQSIECSPLSEVRFGPAQVAQIARAGLLTPEQLQDSINAFAFDLAENQKAKNISGVPLNYFMGILRKGPYAPPVNYESLEDRQQRLYLEAKEQQRKQRQERDARLESLEYEEWAEKLSPQQRAELVPPTDFAKPGSQGHNVQLKQYFREHVWPERMSTISSEGLVHETKS
jgi:hypothetical protein